MSSKILQVPRCPVAGAVWVHVISLPLWRGTSVRPKGWDLVCLSICQFSIKIPINGINTAGWRQYGLRFAMSFFGEINSRQRLCWLCSLSQGVKILWKEKTWTTLLDMNRVFSWCSDTPNFYGQWEWQTEGCLLTDRQCLHSFSATFTAKSSWSPKSPFCSTWVCILETNATRYILGFSPKCWDRIAPTPLSNVSASAVKNLLGSWCFILGGKCSLQPIESFHFSFLGPSINNDVSGAVIVLKFLMYRQ